MVIHPVALGSEHGEADLTDAGSPSNAGLSTLRFDGSEGMASTRVPVRRLDRYVGEKQVVDFIKLDVEGYEDRVLDGCSSLFRDERVRFMLIELSPEFMDVGFVARFLEADAAAYEAYLVHLRKGVLRWYPELVPLESREIARRSSQSSLLIARRQDVAVLQRFLPDRQH